MWYKSVVKRRQFVLLINGAIGAGKTTLANFLKKKLPQKTVFLDLDNIRTFFNSYEQTLYYNNLTRLLMLDIAVAYIKQGCNVVIASSWPIKFQKQLKRRLKGIKFVHIFLDIHLKTSIQRAKRGRVVSRIKSNHRYYSMQKDETAFIIDSNKPPQTVRKKAMLIISSCVF